MYTSISHKQHFQPSSDISRVSHMKNIFNNIFHGSTPLRYTTPQTLSRFARSGYGRSTVQLFDRMKPWPWPEQKLFVRSLLTDRREQCSLVSL